MSQFVWQKCEGNVLILLFLFGLYLTMLVPKTEYLYHKGDLARNGCNTELKQQINRKYTLK